MFNKKQIGFDLKYEKQQQFDFYFQYYNKNFDVVLVSTASGGSGGNIIRGIGHGQFLAMCAKLSIPAIPKKFIKLAQEQRY